MKNERGKVKGVMARWRYNVISSLRHNDLAFVTTGQNDNMTRGGGFCWADIYKSIVAENAP